MVLLLVAMWCCCWWCGVVVGGVVLLLVMRFVVCIVSVGGVVWCCDVCDVVLVRYDGVDGVVALWRCDVGVCGVVTTMQPSC